MLQNGNIHAAGSCFLRRHVKERSQDRGEGCVQWSLNICVRRAEREKRKTRGGKREIGKWRKRKKGVVKVKKGQEFLGGGGEGRAASKGV